MPIRDESSDASEEEQLPETSLDRIIADQYGAGRYDGLEASSVGGRVPFIQGGGAKENDNAIFEVDGDEDEVEVEFLPNRREAEETPVQQRESILSESPKKKAKSRAKPTAASKEESKSRKKSKASASSSHRSRPVLGSSTAAPSPPAASPEADARLAEKKRVALQEVVSPPPPPVYVPSLLPEQAVASGGSPPSETAAPLPTGAPILSNSTESESRAAIKDSKASTLPSSPAARKNRHSFVSPYSGHCAIMTPRSPKEASYHYEMKFALVTTLGDDALRSAFDTHRQRITSELEARLANLFEISSSNINLVLHLSSAGHMLKVVMKSTIELSGPVPWVNEAPLRVLLGGTPLDLEFKTFTPISNVSM